MLRKLVTIFVILSVHYKFISAIHSTSQLPQNANRKFSARQMGQLIAQCFGQNEIVNCLENKLLQTLDMAIKNNDTWQFSEYFTLEKIAQSTDKDYDKFQNFSRQQRSLGDTMAVKLLQLARSRSLKLQLPSSVTSLLDKAGISGGLDDFINSSDTSPSSTTSLQEEGTQRILNGLVDDKIASITSKPKKPYKFKPYFSSSPLCLNAPLSLLTDKNKIWYLTNKYRKKPPKGRKKKDKDKNMAMMGGMAMIAMVAQMFLGKVILIAGAAFVMAKIALLVSVLVS